MTIKVNGLNYPIERAWDQLKQVKSSYFQETRQKDNKNEKLKEKSGKFKQKENGVNCKGKDGGEDEWKYTG